MAKIIIVTALLLYGSLYTMKFCAYCEHPNSAIIIKTFFFGFVIMLYGKEGHKWVINQSSA